MDLAERISELSTDHLEQELEQLKRDYTALLEQKNVLETRVRKGEERRRALMHILSDLNTLNRKLSNQRKAVIHILADYEQERSRLARQTERLDNSRRALMHILQDSHSSNLRLENSRKAMIHIMSDLKETTEEVRRREQELREKQEQLVQAAKLATLGELTTGVAHELNNPLNNIGLFIGNAIDLIELGMADTEPESILQELHSALQQVRKATEIISHLRTFGRAASVSREPVEILQIIHSSISLMHEQLRLRQIEVVFDFAVDAVVVIANPIQLEQVFINLLTNARDALAESTHTGKRITISCRLDDGMVELRFKDNGPGISQGLEQRIFDPFFTTKEVGTGTGLGLSITYGIIKEHQGSIAVENQPGAGAQFVIHLPLDSGEGEGR
ncbi:MAG: GHKL domain-containing protein [Ktedonobacteraceae bacterium]|nr:GHKL domain-containing protein [Ktedonobacteraceae bacterium]